MWPAFLIMDPICLSIAKGLFSCVSGEFLWGRIFQSPSRRCKPGCLCLEWTKEGWRGSWVLICRLFLKFFFTLALPLAILFVNILSGSGFSRRMVTRPKEVGMKMQRLGSSFYKLSNNLLTINTYSSLPFKVLVSPVSEPYGYPVSQTGLLLAIIISAGT